VTLWDECLGWLLEAMAGHARWADTLVVFTAPRGYPLGEHGRVGLCDQALYGELLHVPLMVCYPRSEHRRLPALVQSGGLHSILSQWLGFTDSSANPDDSRLLTGQPLTYSFAPGEQAIRSPAWFLRESRQGGERVRELFVKPDDRWEANEVSSRCGEVTELLAAQLGTFEQVASENALASLPPLAEILTSEWR
jgi:hypothetical protein